MIKVLSITYLSFIILNVCAQKDSLRRISNNWKSKGNFFSVQKKLTLAFDAYSKGISVDSSNSIVYYKMYLCQLKIGNEKALHYLKKSFEYDPFINDTILLELSDYYLNHGNYKMAKNYQSKHNKLYQTNFEFNYTVRKFRKLLDSAFKKRIILFLPLKNYKVQLPTLITYLKETNFKCSINSFYTVYKDYFKNISEGKKNATLIKDYLVSEGVSKSTIKIVNYGNSKQLIDQKDLLANKYNNRVEIEIIW